MHAVVNKYAEFVDCKGLAGVQEAMAVYLLQDRGDVHNPLLAGYVVASPVLLHGSEAAGICQADAGRLHYQRGVRCSSLETSRTGTAGQAAGLITDERRTGAR